MPTKPPKSQLSLQSSGSLPLRLQQTLDAGTTSCKWCHKTYGRGLATHESSCSRRPKRKLPPNVDEPQAKKRKITHEREESRLSPLLVRRDEEPPPVDEDGPSQMVDEDRNPESQVADPVPQAAPKAHIKIVHHPHSGRDPEIIALEHGPDAPDSSSSYCGPDERPWAPFRSLADFEFAESVVKHKLPREAINDQLHGIHNSWSTSGSTLSFHTYKDVRESLDAARAFINDFTEGSIDVTFKGVTRTIHFWYRDPWEWTTDCASDPELVKTHNWHSCRKFYCDGNVEERIIDDLSTADDWWNIESTLPAPDPIPHCLMPYVLWLDKAKVGRKRKLHPMLLRPGWQHFLIRNASGNGGGLFFGLMPVVKNPSKSKSASQSAPAPEPDSEWDDVDLAIFLRIVYHKIFAYVFDKCKEPSHTGWALECGDKVDRIIYPGFLLKTVDGEEAHYLNCCRAASAHYPCPKCLIFHSDMSKLSVTGPARTTESMRKVYESARAATTKTDREKILQKNGMHLVKDFMWEFGHTDPYAAYGYDTLHSDDLGKNGDHLWPLICDEIEKIDGLLFNDNMGRFPIWPRLEQFDPARKPVTGIDFADGETYFGILKRLNPCVVQILPSGSCLVQAAGWYMWYRMMVGLKCISVEQLKYLKSVIIPQYERWCTAISREYGKDFAFFKQHAAAHVVDDILGKGTTQNQSTRPGEGFQQEVKQQYDRTDKRLVEPQIARMDAEEEAIAKIRSTINEYNAQKRRELALQDDEHAQPETSDSLYGSPSRRWSSCSMLERELVAERGSHFRGFEQLLRQYVQAELPELAQQLHGALKIMVYKCAYIQYSSVEDFRAARDILRCNPIWNGAPRYDCALLDEPGKLNPARLRLLFCVKFSDGRTVELAAVTRFKPSKWKPRTVWRGCRVFDEQQSLAILKPTGILRGALMCPAFGAPSSRRAHYLVDCIDGDMFLRANDLAVPFNQKHFKEKFPS